MHTTRPASKRARRSGGRVAARGNGCRRQHHAYYCSEVLQASSRGSHGTARARRCPFAAARQPMRGLCPQKRFGGAPPAPCGAALGLNTRDVCLVIRPPLALAQVATCGREGPAVAALTRRPLWAHGPSASPPPPRAPAAARRSAACVCGGPRVPRRRARRWRGAQLACVGGCAQLLSTPSRARPARLLGLFIAQRSSARSAAQGPGPQAAPASLHSLHLAWMPLKTRRPFSHPRFSLWVYVYVWGGACVLFRVSRLLAPFPI